MYWKIDEYQTRLPLKKGRKRTSDCLPIQKGKKSHYKNTQGVSLSFFNKKKCEVSDSVPWEVTVSAVREPQIISLWDLGAEGIFLMCKSFILLQNSANQRKKKTPRKMW